MTNWQPIETAPRDGTEILVARVGGMPWVVRWEKMQRVEDMWRSAGLGPIPFAPTHWTHLPPPPTGEGE